MVEGDRVAAGDVLLHLDPTLLQVGLDISRARLAEALARRARFEAGAASPNSTYPPLPFPPARHCQGRGRPGQILAARAELLEGDAARLEETPPADRQPARGGRGPDRCETRAAEELVPQIVTTMKQLDRVEIARPPTAWCTRWPRPRWAATSPRRHHPAGRLPRRRARFRASPRPPLDRSGPSRPARGAPAQGRGRRRLVWDADRQVTGRTYYRVALNVPDSALERLGAVPLVLGMPIEAFLETGERMVMRYI